MKKSNFVRYLAYFTLILIFLNILPAGAFATENLSEQKSKNQDQYMHGGTDNYRPENISDTNNTQINKNEISNSESDPEGLQNNQGVEESNKISEYKEFRKQIKEELQVQREEYKKSKEAFLKIKNQIRTGELDPNSEEALIGTKAYLNSTINYMIAHLSSVKKNMEYSNSNKIEEEMLAIDEKISLLEAEKAKVAKASNQKELVATVKSLQETWNNAQKVSLAGAGHIVSEKIGEFLETSGNLSKDIELELLSLKGNGTDTSDLEIKLTSYKSYIESAKEKKEAADTIYEDKNATHNIMKKANNYLREALIDINDANRILKQIFDKLKEYETEKVG